MLGGVCADRRPDVRTAYVVLSYAGHLVEREVNRPATGCLAGVGQNLVRGGRVTSGPPTVACEQQSASQPRAVREIVGVLGRRDGMVATEFFGWTRSSLNRSLQHAHLDTPSKDAAAGSQNDDRIDPMLVLRGLQGQMTVHLRNANQPAFA